MSLTDDLFGGLDNTAAQNEWYWRQAAVDHANREFPQIQGTINDFYNKALTYGPQAYFDTWNLANEQTNKGIDYLSQVPGMSYNALTNGYNLASRDIMGASGGGFSLPSYGAPQYSAPMYGNMPSPAPFSYAPLNLPSLTGGYSSYTPPAQGSAPSQPAPTPSTPTPSTGYQPAPSQPTPSTGYQPAPSQPTLQAPNPVQPITPEALANIRAAYNSGDRMAVLEAANSAYDRSGDRITAGDYRLADALGLSMGQLANFMGQNLHGMGTGASPTNPLNLPKHMEGRSWDTLKNAGYDPNEFYGAGSNPMKIANAMGDMPLTKELIKDRFHGSNISDTQLAKELGFATGDTKYNKFGVSPEDVQRAAEYLGIENYDPNNYRSIMESLGVEGKDRPGSPNNPSATYEANAAKRADIAARQTTGAERLSLPEENPTTIGDDEIQRLRNQSRVQTTTDALQPTGPTGPLTNRDMFDQNIASGSMYAPGATTRQIDAIQMPPPPPQAAAAAGALPPGLQDLVSGYTSNPTQGGLDQIIGNLRDNPVSAEQLASLTGGQYTPEQAAQFLSDNNIGQPTSLNTGAPATPQGGDTPVASTGYQPNPWQGPMTFAPAPGGTGLTGSTDTLNQTLGFANQNLQQGGQNALGAINSGLGNSDAALLQGLGGANTAIGMGAGQGRSDLLGMANYGFGALAPYQQAGSAANDQMAALTGLKGNDYQQGAIEAVMASPEFDFYRDQGEQGVLRNSAALGGLRGGNVQKDLVRFNQDLASTQFGNYYDRLKGMSDKGLSAAGTTASLAGNSGNALANLGMGAGSAMGSAYLGTGDARSRNMLTGGFASADVISGVAGNQSNNALGVGGQVAGNQYGTGNTLAGYGFGGASQLAGQYPGLASAAANSYNNLATLTGQLGNNYAQQLANLYTGQGRALNDASYNRWNLLGGFGSYSNPVQTQGQLSQIGQLAQGIGTGIGAP